MNLKVLSWLLRHRDLLVAVLKVAQDYRPGMSYAEQWEIVDKIARLVIPVLQSEEVEVRTFWAITNEDVEAMSLYDQDSQLMAAGAEVQALGLDWKTLANVVLPILIAILEGLLKK